MPTPSLATVERKALAALLRWWREDVKPRKPNEDNPASEGWAYDRVWNAAKALHHARLASTRKKRAQHARARAEIRTVMAPYLRDAPPGRP